jgi:GT2 family glycosyltransferase
VVVFIDDDVRLAPGFLAAHAANYRDPRVWAVAGRTFQPGGWSVPRPRGPRPRLLDYRYLALDGSERIEGIASFIGCNHSVRRERIVSLGGYDENYIGWAYREDTDAAIRIWKAGGTIVYDPKASLEHLAAPQGGCRIEKDRAEWTVSFPSVYFAFRHHFPGSEFWRQTLFGNVRRWIFRRDNVIRPWRLPGALTSYLYAVLRAALLAARQSGPRGGTAVK